MMSLYKYSICGDKIESNFHYYLHVAPGCVDLGIQGFRGKPLHWYTTLKINVNNIVLKMTEIVKYTKRYFHPLHKFRL